MSKEDIKQIIDECHDMYMKDDKPVLSVMSNDLKWIKLIAGTSLGIYVMISAWTMTNISDNIKNIALQEQKIKSNSERIVLNSDAILENSKDIKILKGKIK